MEAGLHSWLNLTITWRAFSLLEVEAHAARGGGNILVLRQSRPYFVCHLPLIVDKTEVVVGSEGQMGG